MALLEVLSADRDMGALEGVLGEDRRGRYWLLCQQQAEVVGPLGLEPAVDAGGAKAIRQRYGCGDRWKSWLHVGVGDTVAVRK